MRTDRRSWVAGLLVGAGVVAGGGEAAAIPLLRGFGGPAGFGANQLALNDDSSTDEIQVGAYFPSGLWFFGQTFRSLWLNNNGNVTFGGRLSQYTPRAFPVASQRMIAPWWGDVDTRGGGVPLRNGVWWHLAPGRFIATWHNVGYFSAHDDLQNSFQLILSDRSDRNPGDFDVEFRYERCEWTTGDASGGTNGFGGTPAQAGFDGGNLRDYFALPGSLTRDILNVCRTSNTGVAGQWVFQIRSGTVAVCGNRARERGEDCDDGNTRNGDGCSSQCRVEIDGGVDAGFDAGPWDAPRDRGVEAGPDIGWIRDLGVEEDTVPPTDVVKGVDVQPVVDAPAPPDVSVDAGVEGDACAHWRCGRELRLGGRAGPFGGCECRATPRSSSHVPGFVFVALAAFGVGVSRHRRRR